VTILALYFNEPSADAILREFDPGKDSWGEIGFYQVLSKKIPETGKTNEMTLGYDLIGIETGGGFHSFHCHGIGDELSEKFGLTMNNFGLFDTCTDWQPVLTALNTGEIGCEPVPWVVAKTKLIRFD
jgi:hypothetical protein